MQWLGKISYSFYLIHMCMIEFAKRMVTQPVLAALVAFTASIVYSAASWYWVESPILHGGNRKVARKEVRSAMPMEHGRA
jgi:peptidoglycan/LPS O-acetylase OafA/YrhL